MPPAREECDEIAPGTQGEVLAELAGGAVPDGELAVRLGLCGPDGPSAKSSSEWANMEQHDFLSGARNQASKRRRGLSGAVALTSEDARIQAASETNSNASLSSDGCNITWPGAGRRKSWRRNTRWAQAASCALHHSRLAASKSQSVWD